MSPISNPNLSSYPTEALIAIFDEMGRLSENLKASVRQHRDINKRSADDAAGMILAYRAIKFIDAYLLVARQGYHEPSATLARAIYETYLFARWVLAGNGEKYENTFLYKLEEVVKKFDKHGKTSSEARSALAERQKIASSKKTGRKQGSNSRSSAEKEGVPPPVGELARQTGMERYHELVYEMLCSYAHGNCLGSVDALSSGGNEYRVTFQPDFQAMQLTAGLTGGLARALFDLFNQFWANGKLAGIPQI